MHYLIFMEKLVVVNEESLFYSALSPSGKGSGMIMGG